MSITPEQIPAPEKDAPQKKSHWLTPRGLLQLASVPIAAISGLLTANTVLDTAVYKKIKGFKGFKHIHDVAGPLADENMAKFVELNHQNPGKYADAFHTTSMELKAAHGTKIDQFLKDFR